jgi:methionyl-tRNA formyltransferase
VLKSYISDPQALSVQDHSQKSYFPKFDKDSAEINWSWKIEKIERFIRALNPWPIAWTYVDNQQYQTFKMKIFSSNIQSNNLIPEVVQIEGKNKTRWSEISKYYQIKN